MSQAEIEISKMKTKIEVEVSYKFQPIGIGELLKREFSDERWTIENMIPHEGVTIISGAPGSYKTWIMLQMAISIAKGESLFGQFPSKKGGVLMIDEENHLRIIQERLRLLGASEDLPIYFLSQEGFLVTNNKMVDDVLKLCKEKELDVIFMDSLVRVNRAEENDASQMSEVFRKITKLCKNKKTVILSHHERKEGLNKSSAQNRLRGSSDISAAVDSIISVRKDRHNGEKVTIEDGKLRQDKQRGQFELQVESNEDGVRFNYLGDSDLEKDKKFEASELIVAVLEENLEGLSKKDIVSSVRLMEKIGERSIYDAIASLIKDGDVVEVAGKGNSKICFLKSMDQSENVL